MGRIIDRIKADVIEKFGHEQDKSDISQSIDEDGYEFTIVRENGVTLKYNGVDRKFSHF